MLARTEEMKGISARSAINAVTYRKQQRNRNILYGIIIILVALVVYK